MSSALAEAFVAEELSLIQSPDAPNSREICGLGLVFHDHYHSYSLLMDSFEGHPANAVKKAS